MVPSAERRAHPFPPVETLLPASVDRFPCFHTCPAYEQKKRAIPGRIFLIAIYTPMVPSAERRAHPFPPVEMRLPASVDRFPCFHTCPAYEQKKRAIPGRIFLLAIYIPMVPSAERRAHPFPPVEMLLPASVDRFPCFHTCPAYEQKKRAIPGRIFLIAIYIPMVPSAECPLRVPQSNFPNCYIYSTGPRHTAAVDVLLVLIGLQIFRP